MITLVFIFFAISLVILQYKREGNLINEVSLLVIPYLFIIAGNNLIVYRFGFYKISDSVILLLLSSIIAFYIGSLIVKKESLTTINEIDNSLRFSKYNVAHMRNLLYIIGALGLIKLLYLVNSGLFSANTYDDSEGAMSGGPVGHLLLLSYSIAPIVFLYWVEHKTKFSYLFSVLLIIGVTFTTLIKYNVIGIVISLFIFTTLYKKSIVTKASIIMVSSVLGLFVANYVFGFLLRALNVESSFYMNHLWNYAAGSVIYDNYLFPNGIDTQYSLAYKIMTFIMALPNMFLVRIFGGDPLFPHHSKTELPIGFEYGQRSNVTDAFGYLYPVAGDLVEKIAYFAFIIFIGFFTTFLYYKVILKKDYFHPWIANLFTYYIFLSFFGTFYINSAPWEILVYSFIVPNLFLHSTNLRKGIIHLP